MELATEFMSIKATKHDNEKGIAIGFNHKQTQSTLAPTSIPVLRW